MFINKKDPSYFSPWKNQSVNLDSKVFDLLKELAFEKQIPISRLIAIAIDNEMDSPNPFNYPCELPTSEYVPMAYAKEAGLLLNYLMRLPTGTGIDSLVLCRRQIGIPDKDILLFALRELIEKDFAEMYRSFNSTMGYAPGRTLVRYKNVDPDTGKKLPRMKKFMGESLKGMRRVNDDDIKREDDNE